MAAVASMSAALAATHQLRRGTGGDYAVCSGLRRCPGLRQCGDNTDGGTGGGDIVGGGTGGPMYSPMYNPLYGMEACGAGYKYRYRTPERTIRHVPAHVPNFRTMSFLFLDQSCRFSPGSAARRTRLMRYRYTSKHVVMSSRLSRIRLARNESPIYPHSRCAVLALRSTIVPVEVSF